MLELLILTPIIGSFILLFMPSNNVYWIRMIALYTSLFTFIISILIWLFFDYGVSNFQFVSSFLWFSSFNINVFVGIDSISLLFIILTTLIFPLCI